MNDYYPLYKELINSFVIHRKTLRFKTRVLSERTGASMSLISRMEAFSHCPSLETFVRLCEQMEFIVVLAPMPLEMIERRQEGKDEYLRPPVVVEEIVEKEGNDYDNWDYDEDDVFE